MKKMYFAALPLALVFGMGVPSASATVPVSDAEVVKNVVSVEKAAKESTDSETPYPKTVHTMTDKLTKQSGTSEKLYPKKVHKLDKVTEVLKNTDR